MEAVREMSRKFMEQKVQLTCLEEQVDLLKAPKIRIIRLNKPIKLHELQIPENVNVISIPEIKECLNIFRREYAPLQAELNPLFGVRLSFELSEEETKEYVL